MPKPTALLKGFERYVAEPAKHEKAAKALKEGKRAVIFDPETAGLALIVSPKGKRSFSIVARDPANKQVWCRLGDPADMSVAEARQEAAEALRRVKRGEDARPAPKAPERAPETFKQVAERFLERHVDKQGLRRGDEVKRQLNRYIYPEWQDEPLASIRRGRVMTLLEKIEDENGPVMADRVLATLRKLFNWVEVRDEDYTSPIVRGMRVSSAKERARKRVLSDDELRQLWPDWSSAGTFGAFLQTCLLTAQRRGKVLGMRWEDLKEGVWTIPREAREKVNAGALKLPNAALAIIKAQPQIKGNPFVFAGRGKTAIGNLGNEKARMMKRVPLAEAWTIHDLRRTARSLMARAGVRSDIAERALGHVIAGVEGVYDRHSYAEEKAAALEALAMLLDRILKGEEGGKVVQLRAAQ